MSLLQQKIIAASQQYYQSGTSDLTDHQFDELLAEEKKQNPDSPLLNLNHGYEVTKDSTIGERVPHWYGIVGSLPKCHSWEEYPKSYSNLAMWASLKLDGLSVVIYYKNGEMTQALTRGGGEYGIDVTDKIRRILPDKQHILDRGFTGGVRGEILMSNSNFDKFQSTHPEAKNARNSAAGLINCNGVSDDLEFLDILVYTVVGMTPSLNLPIGDASPKYAYRAMTAWIHTNFDKYAPVIELSASQLSPETLVDTMTQLQQKWYRDFPADGIVLTNDTTKVISKDKGRIEIAYDAVAFKFKAETGVTNVIGIEWNLSKTKYLVPRIQLDTLQLSGTNVSWAAGNNANNIVDSKLGVGAEVEVLKSGEIIPYIDNVVTPVEPELPTVCPCCGAELVWSGVHLACPNPECADIDIKDVLIWMNNIAPYDGLGDILKLKYLHDMFGDNISIESIYEDNRHTAMPGYERYTTYFKNMYNQLFDKKVPLATAIMALNIPRFGEKTSAKLAAYPNIVMECIDDPDSIRHNVNYSVELGEANFISLRENITKFSRLNYIRDNILWDTAKLTVEIKGKVAITGTLSVSRKQFEQELIQHGYEPVSSVKANTLCLITDSPDSNTSKNVDANKYGVTKLTESQFRDQYM